MALISSAAMAAKPAAKMALAQTCTAAQPCRCYLLPRQHERFLLQGATQQSIRFEVVPRPQAPPASDQAPPAPDPNAGYMQVPPTTPAATTQDQKKGPARTNLCDGFAVSPEGPPGYHQTPVLVVDPESTRTRLPGELKYHQINGEGFWTLDLKEVPVDLPSGQVVWKVLRARGEGEAEDIADLPLHTATLADATSIDVAYDDPVMEELHRGIANLKAGRPIAVVNPLWSIQRAAAACPEPGKDAQAVMNRVAMPAPVGLPIAPPTSYEYQINTTTWMNHVLVDGCESGGPTACMGRAPCALKSLAAIHFSVRQRSSAPLVAGLRMLTRDADTRERVVFEKLLTLATEARIESLPLNHLAQKMWISCEDEKPWAARKPERSREPYGLCNGGVMPVKDAVFLSGLCRVHLGVLDISCAERSASRTDRGNPWNSPRQIQLAQPPDDGDGASRQQAYERSRRRMILSGPQVVRIAVRRDGTADDGISTVVVSPLAQFDANGWAGGDRASDPLSEEQKAARRLAPIASLEMTLPPKAAEGEGPFRVRVAVGAVAPTPVYRDEMTPLTAAAVDSSNLFSAQLSPRGPFGFKGAPIRMFVTVPVQAMGVQLPANPRNLTSSQDSRYYEVSTLRTGVMVGLEPWDYTLRKSLFPVPFRVLAGFQFVSIDGRAARFDPRFEVAFKVTLPLIDSDKKLGSQFGTSVTLGPAFNIDLADGHPYFVFHLGFDVLTLFAAK